MEVYVNHAHAPSYRADFELRPTQPKRCWEGVYRAIGRVGEMGGLDGGISLREECEIPDRRVILVGIMPFL